MGIGRSSLVFLGESIVRTVGGERGFNGLRMLELGDQKLHPDIQLTASGERVWAKDLFEEMGYHHYMIDWHGKNGAYPINLSFPIKDPFWFEKFDVVTNFGTIEHVENQYVCWQNVHNFARPGGLFVHFLPMKWPKEHCNYLYSTKFVAKLIEANNYTGILIETFSGVLTPSGEKCETIHASFTKSKHPANFRPGKKEFLSWIK